MGVVCVLLLVVLLLLDRAQGQLSEGSRVFRAPESPSEKIKTFFDYTTHIVAYKDLIESKCYLETIKDGAQQDRYHLYNQASNRGLYISTFRLTKMQVVNLNAAEFQIWRLAGSRVAEFCRGYPTRLLRSAEQAADENGLGEEPAAKERPRRQTTGYFRGRKYRGQTQSQYLNYGSGSEPGKAEAESTPEGSRAVVSGNSGMGQAQSQSGFGGGCEDCFGPDSQTQVLSYRPGTSYGPGTYTPGVPRPDRISTPGVVSGPPGPEEISKPGEYSPGVIQPDKTIPGTFRPTDTVEIPGQIPGRLRPGETVPGAYRPGQFPSQTPGELKPGELVPGSYKPDDSFRTPEQFPSQTPGGLRPGESVPGVYRPGQFPSQIPEELIPGAYKPDDSFRTPGQFPSQTPGGLRPGSYRPTDTFGQFPGQIPSRLRPGETVPPEYRPGDALRTPGQFPGQIPGRLRPGEAVPGYPGAPGQPGIPGRPGEIVPPRPGYDVEHPVYRPGHTFDQRGPTGPNGVRPGDITADTRPRYQPAYPHTAGETDGLRPGEIDYRPGVQPTFGQTYPLQPGLKPADRRYPVGPGGYPSALRPGEYHLPRQVHGGIPGALVTSQIGILVGQVPVGGLPSTHVGYPSHTQWPDGSVQPAPGQIAVQGPGGRAVYAPGIGETGDVSGTYRPGTYGQQTGIHTSSHVPGAYISGQMFGSIPGQVTGQAPGEFAPGLVQQPGTFIPGRTPGHQLDYIPGRTPGYQPSQVPGSYIPGKRPSTYIPGQEPGAYDSGQQPVVYIPGQTPGAYITGQQPGTYIPGQQPGVYTPVQQPGTYIPGQRPETYIPGQQPGAYTPGQQPGTYTPGQQPGAYTPGQQPGTYIPGQQPGAYTPGQQPGTYIPGQQPGAYTPGQQPGTYIPGQQPGTYAPEQQLGTYTPGQQPGTYIPGQQPGTYIPGQQPGAYTPGQLPGTFTPGQQPGTYTPGQQPETFIPGQSPGAYPPEQQPGTYIPGQQPQEHIPTAYLPGTREQIPGTYIPGQTPGTYIPGTYSPGQIPGQVPSQIPGTRITSQPVQYVDGTRPGQWTGVQPEDDSDSQAQSSVHQVNNDTQASASAQGRYAGGTAQSQVSGTYSGSGSFNAQAGTYDGKRGSQTQVSGNKDSVTSSAQGNGGSGQSQSQVQYNVDTGGTMSSAQSGGSNHGSNTQVQAGDKGGMADAQANGPGLTSSQAQIGFSPYDESETDDQNTPFRGGGTASAQSGSYTGQSQAQIQGKFRYGIRYTGAAQAGSGTKESIAAARNQTRPEGLTGNFPAIKTNPIKPDSFTSGSKTATEGETNSRATQNVPSHDKPNKAHANPTPSPTPASTTTTTLEPTTYPQSKTDEDDYDEEDDYDYDSTDEPSEDTVITQSTKSQRQHIVLGPLEDIDARVVQAYGDPDLKEGMVIQPGETIPGTPGYKVPPGFRMRITSVANGDKTSASGLNSQAQSVTVVPGAGKVIYSPPKIQFTQVRSGYPPNSYKIEPYRRQLTYPKFLTVTKSESGSANPVTGQRNPQVYYTQSSTCGFFTNTCVYSGAKKICIPKAKSNPDGSPMRLSCSLSSCN